MHSPPPAAPWITKSIREIVPQISHAEFQAGQEGYVLAVPAGTAEMPEIRTNLGHRHAPVIQRPINMPPQEPGFPKGMAFPDMVIARLRNVWHLPSAIIVTQSGNVLLDSFSSDWELPHHTHMTGNHTDGWTPTDRHFLDAEPAIVSAPVFHLDYMLNKFFGHYIIDSITRSWGLAYATAWLGLDHAQLVTLISEPYPYIPGLLNLLGFSPRRIIHAPIAVFCRELIIATKAIQIQEYAAPTAPGIWRHIARQPGIEALKADWPEKLYVSRSRNHNRMMIGEDRVERLLESLGYHIFHPEDHPIETQIAAMRHARKVIGPSGSSVFTLGFLPPTSRAAILASPRLVHYSEMFFRLGSLTPLGIHIGQETNERPGDVHAPWTVDPAAFEADIHEWDMA